MKKILVLEDNLDLGESMMRVLEMRGHDAVWAKTVTEGISLYEVDQFDILLCDWELPDGVGLDLIKFAQDHEEEWATFVILSGLDRTPEVRRSSVRVDHILVKSDVMALLDILDG